MFKQVVLIFFVIFVVNCLSSNEKSKTALFISIPYIGHINPLLNQAIELYHRHKFDYNIYIISCSNVKTYVEKNCFNTTIQFLDIGQCQNESELLLNLELIVSQADFLAGTSKLFQAGFDHYYGQMYQQKTIITIIDRVTYAGADIADHFNIPYIINAASLLLYLAWLDILP